MTCHNCGAENESTKKFCENCGTALEPFLPSSETQIESSPPLVETQIETGDEKPPRGPLPVNNRIILIGAISAGVLVLICVVASLASFLIYQPSIKFNPGALFGETSPTPRPSSTRRDLAVQTPAPILATPTLGLTPLEATATPAAAGSTPAVLKKWTALQVANAFKAAGLEFANSRVMTQDDYGSAPQIATSGIRFFLPSLGGTKGGRIYSFATSSNLQSMKQFYASQSPPPWIYVKDNILVQIHSDLPENRARQYQNALNTLQ